MTKPPLFPDNIPASLKALPQWVCWRLEEVGGRMTKVPYRAKDHGKARTNVPADWATFDEALAAYQNGDFSGIGFVLAASGQVGFDIDHCLTDGKLHPDAELILRKLNTYTEVTQSGTGVHVMLLGAKPTHACVKKDNSWGGECACFETTKFFVMTGNLLPGYPTDLQPRQAALNEVCAQLWPVAFAQAQNVRAVLELHAAGRGVREIARQLNLPPATVSRYIQKNRPGTVPVAVQSGGTLVEQAAGTPPESARETGVPTAVLDSGTGVPAGVPPSNPGVPPTETALGTGVPAPKQGVPPGNLAGVPRGVPPVEAEPFEDDEILELIRNSKAAAKFEDLWAGNWNTTNTRFVSQSEADLSLCWHLAFYTKDAVQIDRIFRQSGMMRDKWDEPRAESTYGSVTIEKALDTCTEQYHSRRRTKKKMLAAADILDPNSPAAVDLLERGKAFAAELKEQPEVTRLTAAIGEFLWQLPDLFLDTLKPLFAESLGNTFKVPSFNKAIQNERKRRKKSAATAYAQEMEQNPANKSELRNHTVELTVDDKGNPVEYVRAVALEKIAANFLRFSGDWPRRVGSLLFVDKGGKIQYLENQDQLFAWLQLQLPVFWMPGLDAIRQVLTTKAEFLAHLQAATTAYKTVEAFPHEPAMQDAYYAWKWPKGYTATGEYFEHLLQFFDNPETEADRALIRAAFMTPAWGGRVGKRPAFAILAKDVGCGKSTLAEVIGQLYGGHFELAAKQKDDDRWLARLLTPDALTKRTVRVDNVKNTYGSEQIEGLITAAEISGYRLYEGEATRPNTLTYIITGNGLKLSRDMAERSFIIRLGEPTWRRGWDDGVKDFVAEQRDQILADIVAQLLKPPVEVNVSDRWLKWVTEVLARATPQVEEVVTQNQARRKLCDEALEECMVIMESLDKYLSNSFQMRVTSLQIGGEDTSDLEPEGEVFVSATDMTDLLNRALKENMTARAARARIEGHMEAGRLPRVKDKRTATARGYVISR